METLKKFVDNTDEWNLYNGFFLNNDIERLRKFLVREHFLVREYFLIRKEFCSE